MRRGTDTDKVTLPSIDDVPTERWKRLAQLRIFFGHQSVGYNIVDGITDVMNEHAAIDLNVVETCEPQRCAKPVFAHARVGRNTDPFSKIQTFREMLESGAGDSVDVAFFKFCYVDIVRDSDPKEIFDSYDATLKGLKNLCPGTKFLHVTVPIRSAPSSAMGGLKQSLKSLLGKPGVLDDNVVRAQYNKLLTDAYGETEPLFDLALAESVDPHGSRCYAGKGPQRVCVMACENTDDGGHLSFVGRKRAAEQLLITLAEIANNP
ncbi:MAG: hypothetical protein ACYSWQ_20020 [Planctomycetota bacterium]|jgi:hypothetical protein